MINLRATTLDGLRAQAHAMVVNCWSGLIEPHNGCADDRMIMSIVSGLTGIPITDKAVRS